MSKVKLIHSISNINQSVVRLNLFSRLPYSKFVFGFVRFLYKFGYISGYRLVNRFYIDLFFKFTSNSIVLKFIKLISKPGRRVFFSYNLFRRKYLNHSNDCFVFNTSLGLLDGRELCRFRVGGELLAIIR